MKSEIEKYPVSRRERVVENYHGTVVSDDFRWLEGDAEGHPTPETDKWTDEQNALTRSILDRLPGRFALRERLRPLLETDSCWLPVFAGLRLFWFKRPENLNQPIVCMSEGLATPERILLDPNLSDPSGLSSVGWFEPSPDGSMLAYGICSRGDENYELRILRVSDLSHLEDRICNKVVGVFWLPDGRSFIYSKLADPANSYSREIRLHHVGDSPEHDRLIFAQYREGPFATTWGPSAWLSEDGRWLVLSYYTSTRSNDLWLVDFAAWQETGELVRHDIIVGGNSRSAARVVDGRLIILTNEGASNSMVFTTSLSNPGRSEWQILVPENPAAVIEDWGFTSESLLLTYQENAVSNIVSIDLATGSAQEVELPGIGSVHFSCSPLHRDFFIDYTSFDCPNVILHYGLPASPPQIWWQREMPVDVSQMQVSQQWFTSRDGTRVSMFLLHRKDMVKNGANPTLIYGYGGFAISMIPAWNGPVIPWVEDGGIYAVVNLRGGAEKGDEWHKMGMLGNKERVFEDFEAAAEWLIASGYTCPERLAVSGRSNGGLLVGAAITRRPDLFRAAICGVPLLDMLRYQNFLMARYWVPEYGSSENATDFIWLRRYSPYHNIVSGRRYPATYIFTAEKDTRVHPMHARKMTAALQTLADNGCEEPILLWVERNAGHGVGKPLAQILEEFTDQWIFLRWQLGMI